MIGLKPDAPPLIRDSECCLFQEMITMRFDDDTTLSVFLAAVAPVLQRIADRGELTAGKECFGAACEFARLHPESQTATDLLRWAHGSTPEICVEIANSEAMEDWIAVAELPAFDSMKL